MSHWLQVYFAERGEASLCNAVYGIGQLNRESKAFGSGTLTTGLSGFSKSRTRAGTCNVRQTNIKRTAGRPVEQRLMSNGGGAVLEKSCGTAMTFFARDDAPRSKLRATMHYGDVWVTPSVVDDTDLIPEGVMT